MNPDSADQPAAPLVRMPISGLTADERALLVWVAGEIVLAFGARHADAARLYHITSGRVPDDVLGLIDRVARGGGGAVPDANAGVPVG